MNKTTLVICSLLLMTGLAQAQSIREALINCSQENDSLKRLVCYDRLAAEPNLLLAPAPPQEAKTSASERQAKTRSPALTQPTPMRPDIPEKATIAADDFGMEHKNKLENAQDKIYAQLTVINKDPYKKLLLTLDNGQRWKQTDSVFLRLRVGEQVYVERGALGSFFLSKDGKNRRLRVKRIK
ncbi:MAG: hypothetical protein ACI965_000085 [Paraglaciecola sp.]|jgi:hypothetical protein